MNPTPRLRFVERIAFSAAQSLSDGSTNVRTVRVLQQWFAYDIEYPMTRGEWRDVPLEKESNGELK
jgi:hypothetical protein